MLGTIEHVAALARQARHSPSRAHREQDMLEYEETVIQVMSCWAERELTLTFARQAILHICLAAEARHFEHASVQKVHHDWGGA